MGANRARLTEFKNSLCPRGIYYYCTQIMATDVYTCPARQLFPTRDSQSAEREK